MRNQPGGNKRQRFGSEAAAVLSSSLGSRSLPTAPLWSPAWKVPEESQKKERCPVRPYSEGIAAISYFAGAPVVLAPTIT